LKRSSVFTAKDRFCRALGLVSTASCIAGCQMVTLCVYWLTEVSVVSSGVED